MSIRNSAKNCGIEVYTKYIIVCILLFFENNFYHLLHTKRSKTNVLMKK